MALRTITVPFGEWRPDSADLNMPYLSVAKNVLPTATGYRRMGGFSALTGTLPAAAVGAAFVISSTGLVLHTIAGTAATLQHIDESGTVTDVTRAAGGAYSASASNRWYFAQSGSAVVAVNPNDDPQHKTSATSTADFIALAGSPPRARGVSQVGDFLVLWGLTSNPSKLQWSAINDITGWTVGTALSDEQIFPDLGPITGVYGDQTGFVLQQHGVRTLQFLPGDTSTIFRFDKVAGAAGCVSPYGWVAAPDGNIYYVSHRGFHSIGPSGYRDLGHQRVNDWFKSEAVYDFRHYLECTAHVSEPLIVWAFTNTVLTPGTYDRIVVYNYVLDRFVHGDPSIEALVKHSYGYPSAPYSSSSASVYGFNSSHVLSHLGNVATAAVTLTTAEQELNEGKMTLLSTVRPLATMSELDNMDVADAYRNTLEASPTTSTSSTANTDGSFSIGTGGITARYHRLTVSATTTGAATTDRFTGVQVRLDAAGDA